MNDMRLRYAPLVPRAGMRRFFEACVAAWGDPNNHDGLANWPKETLDLVCERGELHLLVFDRHACAQPTYYITDRIVAK